MKKYVLLSLSMSLLFIVIGFSVAGLGNKASTCLACEAEGGIVDKRPCESFKAKIVFKNTGTTEGTWAVNIAFEGESWTWSGTPLSLTLKASKSKTLTWNGTVPCDAPIDSVARLVVYYNDSFVALDWWIHVVPGAELTVASSLVE
jgi:hypothetical protein